MHSVPVMCARVIFGTWLRQRLKVEKKMCGEKMVPPPERTRRLSLPETDAGAKKLLRRQKPIIPRRVFPGQLSLFMQRRESG